ncbi:MAG: FGGY-family carbohydrate kinase [Candidatus Ranarchaeia archaeon]
MTASNVFVGTDIGTLGTKTLVVDAEGKVLGSAYREYDILTPKPLWAEQWPSPWVDAAYATIKKALHTAKVSGKDIQGLCVSGLYGGSGIPCDKQMKPIRPCLIWMDRRAVDESKWVKENIGEETIFSITGNTIDTYYGFTKILWIKNKEPKNWSRIRWLVTPNAYVIYHLTGEMSIDYSSAGNLGGLYDIHRKNWSAKLMDEMGIPAEFFPDTIVESSAIVGEITSEASKKTGLPSGLPVCAGGIDAPVSAFSVGVTSEGQHAAMIGTSMCWNTIQSFKNKKLTPKLISYPHVVDPRNRIYTFGGAATAGGIVHWFRENIARLELHQQKDTGRNAYQILDKEANAVPPGSNGLIVLPYFMGERTPIWDPWAKGVVVGLTLFHSYKHLFRAFLEGVAYALRHNISSAKSLDIPLEEEMRLVGGGGKSPLWRKIFSDVTKFPVRYLPASGSAPYGDAFLAAIGTRHVPSYEGIEDWLPQGERIDPSPSAMKIYDRYYQLYLKTYRRLKPLFDDLAGLAKLEN